MRLRIRLALAFLLMSVVPLAAITLYSYDSTIKAFRRAAEAEESAIAADMGKRMELVTATVGDRVDRVRAAAQTRDWNAHDRSKDQQFQQEVAATLGEAGNYLSKLQFIPSVPPAPPAPVAVPAPPSTPRVRNVRPPAMPPAPPAVPAVPSLPSSDGAPSPARAPTAAGASESADRAASATATEKATAQRAAEAAHKILDLIPRDSLPPDARAALGNLQGLTGALPQFLDANELKDLAALDGMNLEQARKAIEAGARQAREIQRAAEAERAAARRERIAQMVSRMKQGQTVDIPVQKEGRVVGMVNAEISLPRVLESVVAGLSLQSGEIGFAIDPENHLYVREPKDRTTLESLDLFARVRGSKAPVQTAADDRWVIVAHRDKSGVLFGIARPIGSALDDIRRATGRNLGLGLLAVLVALAGIIPVSGRMTRNLSVLHGAAGKIARGDLSVRVPVRSKDEIGTLSAAFNQMAQDLGAHQKLIAERERLRGELELCRQIQTEMLPKEPLRLGFAEIKGVSIPAREVGGDFFNYFLLPEGEVAVLVGDVSGKGVGAALLMANVQATLRARLSLEHDLASLATAIDKEIDDATPKAVYLTLFMGILDSSHHVLRYVNAGHNPQFVLRANGGLDRLVSTGLPIAMFPGHGYSQSSVTLNDGDILFFYTDGVTEVENEQGDMFGSDRLEELLLTHHEEGVDNLLARIEQEVLAFRGAADLFDDATMMVLRLGSRPAAVTPA